MLLPRNEAKKILKITKTPLTEIVTNSFGSPPLFKSVIPREAGGVVTLRQAILKGEFHYWFKEFPKEFSIKFIKVILQVAILAKAPNASTLFNKLEKISVKKANEYLTECLLADVTKTAIGEVNYSYDSYRGTHQEVAFQYVMNYYPRDSKHGKIAVIFYSSKSFEPPKSQGSAGSAGRPSIWKDTTPWPVGDWQKNEKKRDNDGKLEPFMVEIMGDVIRDGPSVLGFGPVIYSWDKSKGGPIAKVDFSKPVPELEFSELSWLERQKEKIENEIREKWLVLGKLFERTAGARENTGDFFWDVFAKIKSVISQIRHLGAGLVKLPEFEIPEELLPEPEPPSETSPPEGEEILPDGLGGGEFPEIEPESPSETEPEPQPEPELTLAEIQEGLDDIAEEIDIIGQEVAQLVVASQSISEEVPEEASEVPEIEEPEEIVEEPEEIVEEEESEEEPEKGQEEVGQEVGQEFCEKIPGKWPTKNRLIINEVAWMGTNNSAQDEWIELKNISGSEIDLSGWQLLDKDNRIKIIFGGGRASANSFYLLERTNDDSVPGITADFIYTGILNNTNEALYLFNPDCQLEDEVLANPDWPAGDHSSKRTMERKSNLEWQTSGDIGGTPKSENSTGYYENSGGGGGSGGADGGGVDGGSGGTPPPAEPTFCSQDDLSEPTYSPIIINEIAWMGSASSSADEWIELKNASTSTISLESWQILDKGEEIKIIFDDTDSIPVNGFYLLERTDDNSVPNISADKIYTGNLRDHDESLRLFDQNCNLIDEVLANIGDDLDWPAGDKDKRRTMERKEDLTWHTYFGDGENGIMGTPKKENSQPPPAQPILEVSTATFSFGAEEGGKNPESQFLIIKNTGEGDLDWTVSINYTTTSPTSTNNWLSISSTTGTIPVSASSTVEVSVDILGLGPENYNATATVEAIGAKNSPQEISVSLAVLPKSKFAQNVVITEVQIADKEFIELYNPTRESVSMNGWYLSYFPEDSNWNDPNPPRNWEFPATSTIEAEKYYLIGVSQYPQENEDPDADWIILGKTTGKPYSTGRLNNNNGAIGIFSCNPEIATTSTTTLEAAINQAKSCKIDVLGWGEVLVKEGETAIPSPAGKSLARKLDVNDEGYLVYIDTNNNQNDFESQELSPKAINQHSYSDLDNDGIIDSYDNTTTIATTTELQAGEYDFKDLVVRNGAELILNSDFSLGESEFKGVKITAENLVVATSSSITADGKGYPAKEGPGAGAGSAGGSYGGKGGRNTTTSIYGSVEEPIHLGSGGGSTGGRSGGAGGGAIKIEVANTLSVDGFISVNGQNGCWRTWDAPGMCHLPATGAGSGGSIYIKTNTLTGSGLIIANGGDADSAGPGSGGRIAVYYSTNEFEGKIQTFGGIAVQGSAGGPGTVYLKEKTQDYGDLIIDNNNQQGDNKLPETSYIFNDITIINSTHFYLPENLTAENVQIENNIVLEAQTTSTITVNGQFIIKKESSLISPAQIFLIINSNDFSVQQNSKLAGNFNIIVNNFSIDASSSILANGKGYPAGQGAGAGQGGAGGSYGGKGGGNTTTSIYGSVEEPIHLGSGGGSTGGRSGGVGGGAIKIEIADSLTIDGTISVNGQNGRWRYGLVFPDPATGAGSGGSIYIETGTLRGIGFVTVNGGNADTAGAGGGGRIAIYCLENDFGGKIQAFGGEAAHESNNGEPGTIYLKLGNQEGEVFLGEVSP